MAICKECGKEWMCDNEDVASLYYLEDGEEPNHCTTCRCKECRVKA